MKELLLLAFLNFSFAISQDPRFQSKQDYGHCADIPQFMKESDRIVGGQAAPVSIPWQVSMKGGCGGTILDSCTVISAAHCLDQHGVHISVGHEMRMGSTSSSTGGQVRKVSEIILNEANPFYSAVYAGYDFVIFKLDYPLEFNEDVQPACLPNPDFAPEYNSTIGDRCFTSGWGSHFFGEMGVYEYLSYVRVPMIDNEQCSAMYQNIEYFAGKQMPASVTCAGYPEGGKDACQGDSGGPLVCIVNGKAVATGVVSWGEGCATPGFPGVYGRVTHVLDWVKSNMGCEASNTTISTTPTTSTIYSGCVKPAWQGDSYCDDINNNADCDYDGGDCCGENINTTYCNDCQCLDPNFTTTTMPTTTVDPNCEDVITASNYCAYWKSEGYCTHQDYESFMQYNCKKSCGLCQQVICEDVNESCDIWANAGFCIGQYAEYMKDTCPKACHIC